MTAKVYIEINENKKLDEDSRQDLGQAIRDLGKGRYLVNISESNSRGSYSPSRYKYYFDCVLGLAFPKVSKSFAFHKNGKLQHPKTEKELHAILKAVYNPITIVDTSTGEAKEYGVSTTVLSDSEFIGEYLESIVSDFSSPPYFAYPDTGCPTYDEWKQMHKEKTWRRFKDDLSK